MRRQITFLITPSEGIPGQWTAICLELDVWSTGRSIQDAASMVEEAVLICLKDADIGVFEKADPEFWDLAEEIRNITESGRGIHARVSEMDKNTADIRHGVLMTVFLCQDVAGRWTVRSPPSTPPTPDMVPQAA